MKAKEAAELTKTYVDKNMYRAYFILLEIKSLIGKTSLHRLNYCEFFQPWNKTEEEEDRKAIIRNILLKLKSEGYKVVLSGSKGKHTTLKIYW